LISEQPDRSRLQFDFYQGIDRLEKAWLVGLGLTFHGLRHTCGTLRIEAGFDLDVSAGGLGRRHQSMIPKSGIRLSEKIMLKQKARPMAIHSSQTADTSARMRGMMENFDPLGSKKGT
jgi:integrase